MTFQHPVFIGGCPRSGTTMLASVLGNHERVLVTPESQFKIDLIDLLSEDCQIDPKAATQMLNQHFRFKIWKTSLSTPLDSTPVSYRSFMKHLIEEYNMQTRQKDFTHWIDHTPENIRYAKTLRDHFPDARFIHIIRDGRAVARSMKNLTWGGHSPYFTGQIWARNISYGLALKKMLPEDRFLETRYEDILKHPEEEIKRICDFLNLDFNPEMLNTRGFHVPEYTQSQHALIGQNLKSDRIDSWASELSSEEICLFEQVTFELLDYLGYERKYPMPAGKPSKATLLALYLSEGLHRGLNRIKQKSKVRRL